MDETSLQEYLKVKVVAVAYLGKGLPLAWRCYQPGREPLGQVELIVSPLRWLAPVIEPGRAALVAADRGIGNSPRLLQASEGLGWHYLVRVTKRVHPVLESGEEREMGSPVAREGESWAGEVRAIKKAGWLGCRALVCWGPGHQEPWLLLTNYPQARPQWYGTWMWEELAFKGLKSNGWQWQRSRLRQPARAERLWLVMALAYLWVVSLGSYVLARPRYLEQVSRRKGNRLSLFQLGLSFLDRSPGLVAGRLRPINLLPGPTEKSVRY